MLAKGSYLEATCLKLNCGQDHPLFTPMHLWYVYSHQQHFNPLNIVQQQAEWVCWGARQVLPSRSCLVKYFHVNMGNSQSVVGYQPWNYRIWVRQILNL